jgi:hypothetical protein
MIVCGLVEEEEVCAIVLIPQVLIQPRVDNWGLRSSVMSVGLHGRQHQAEEGLLHKGDNNNGDGCRGGGGRWTLRGRGGKKGKRFV